MLAQDGHHRSLCNFPMPTWCTPESISAHCVNGILEIGMSSDDEPSSAEYQVKIG